MTTMKTFLRALYCLGALGLVFSFARVPLQAQSAQFLPEVNTYLTFNPMARVYFQAKDDRDGGDPTQATLGPSVQFFFKPLVKLKKITTFDLDVDPRELTQLRSLRIRALLRRHGDVLETDPNGALMVRGEVLALAPQPQSLEAAAAAGFSVRREWTLPALDLKVVVLHVASGTARALKRLRGLDPGGAYDFNHVYTDSGTWDSVAARRAPAGADPPAAADGSGAAQANTDETARRVGLIDSGVAADHEVFAGLAIHPHGCADRPVPARTARRSHRSSSDAPRRCTARLRARRCLPRMSSAVNPPAAPSTRWPRRSSGCCSSASRSST